jgi:hypothetical protein
MHQHLHHFGFKVPGLAVFFYGVDLRLDQPIIDAEIALHQLYLTKCTNVSTQHGAIGFLSAFAKRVIPLPVTVC